MTTHTTVYRLFDTNRRLLYVGIAGNPGRRFEQHRLDRPWWADVATVTLEHYPARTEASAAEIHAIRTESPVHTIAGWTAPPPARLATPELVARFDALVALDIRLGVLREVAKTIAHTLGDNPEYCADIWSSGYTFRPTLRDLLSDLIGTRATEWAPAELRNHAAAETAFVIVDNELGDCAHPPDEPCLGSDRPGCLHDLFRAIVDAVNGPTLLTLPCWDDGRDDRCWPQHPDTGDTAGLTSFLAEDEQRTRSGHYRQASVAVRRLWTEA
jgi:hypothetical protein